MFRFEDGDEPTVAVEDFVSPRNKRGHRGQVVPIQPAVRLGAPVQPRGRWDAHPERRRHRVDPRFAAKQKWILGLKTERGGTLLVSPRNKRPFPIVAREVRGGQTISFRRETRRDIRGDDPRWRGFRFAAKQERSLHAAHGRQRFRFAAKQEASNPLVSPRNKRGSSRRVASRLSFRRETRAVIQRLERFGLSFRRETRSGG